PTRLLPTHPLSLHDALPIFHPGSHVGQGTDTGIAQICEALTAAMAPSYPVTVLLETMAGKGTEVGGSFQELKAILDGVGRQDLRSEEHTSELQSRFDLVCRL